MKAYGTQLRTGGANFALRISRSAIAAEASSFVVFETTFVEVTTPCVLTLASTVTMPWTVALSLNDGTGACTKRYSESGVQLPRRRLVAAAVSLLTSFEETQPVVPSARRTFDQSARVARRASFSPFFTCTTTSAVVAGSLRTFSLVAVTRTVPTAAGSVGAVTGAGSGSGTVAGGGGGGAAQRVSTVRTRTATERTTLLRRIYEAILFTSV